MNKKEELVTPDEILEFCKPILESLLENPIMLEINRYYEAKLTIDDNEDFPFDEGPYIIANIYFYIIELALNFPSHFQPLFAKLNIYSEIYNRAYVYMTYSFYSKDYWNLIKLISNSFKYISLDTIIDNYTNEEAFSHSLTEYELYNFLQKVNSNEAFKIINLIDADSQLVNQLKQNLFKSNENEFVKIIINNNINWEDAGLVIEEYESISYIKKYCQYIMDNFLFKDEEEIDKGNSYVGEIYNKQFIAHLDEKEFYNLTKAYQLEKNISTEENKERFVLSKFNELDGISLYSLFFNHIKTIIYIFHKKKKIFFNIDDIIEIQSLIDSNEILKQEESKLIKNNFNLAISDVPYNEILEEFKSKFIDKTDILPSDSFGKKKSSNEYFYSRFGIKIENVQSVYESLYYILVNKQLLKWDNEICSSFLYRTVQNYKPKEFTPIPITWYGQTRDLIALVYHLFSEDSRLPSKINRFFISPNGEKYPTNGIKNQAMSQTKLIKSVIEEFSEILKKESF